MPRRHQRLEETDVNQEKIGSESIDGPEQLRSKAPGEPDVLENEGHLLLRSHRLSRVVGTDALHLEEPCAVSRDRLSYRAVSEHADAVTARDQGPQERTLRLQGPCTIPSHHQDARASAHLSSSVIWGMPRRTRFGMNGSSRGASPRFIQARRLRRAAGSTSTTPAAGRARSA